MLGTFALLHVLRHPSPAAAVARVNAFLRAMMQPRRGVYVKRHNRKR